MRDRHRHRVVHGSVFTASVLSMALSAFAGFHAAAAGASVGRNKPGRTLLLALIALVLASSAVWSAPQSAQDLRKTVAEQFRTQRLKSAHLVDGDEDTAEPADPDHAWLLDPGVFSQLSSAGQRALLFLQGRRGEGRGERGAEGRRGVFGRNVRVNDPAIDERGHGQAESSIAARGRNIVVAFNDHSAADRLRTISGYAFSTNGGRTFTHRRLAPVPAGFNLGDPVVAYGPDGELYYSGVSLDAQRRSFIGVAKSMDNGATFSLPVDASTTATNTNEALPQTVEHVVS